MTGLLYLLFFLSGMSGLIYQVVWVRVFGNVFGNTVYSTSLVIAVFMLGLGVGSYRRRRVGRPPLCRPARVPAPRVRLRRNADCGDGAGHFAAAASPRSSVSRSCPPIPSNSPAGTSSRQRPIWPVWRSRVVLLAPITLLMGGTLTLLIRHLVRRDLEVGGRRIAVLYAVNTAGAALGCFLTDFALVPAYGLLRHTDDRGAVQRRGRGGCAPGSLTVPVRQDLRAHGRRPVAPLGRRARRNGRCLSVFRRQWSSTPAWRSRCRASPRWAWRSSGSVTSRFCSGRFRAVFSLLLTVILIGIGVGSLVSGVLTTRLGARAESRACSGS